MCNMLLSIGETIKNYLKNFGYSEEEFLLFFCCFFICG